MRNLQICNSLETVNWRLVTAVGCGTWLGLTLAEWLAFGCVLAGCRGE